jgi:LysR family transcriptional regulator, glycine cleavage system transcriptional activator
MTVIETDVPLMRYKFPPMNTLRTIEAVVRNGSIRRAADELCITPQAVSQQLKQLEQALHRELFYRRDSSIEPTPAARMLVEYLKEGFDRIDEGIQAIQRGPERPQLSLQVSPYFATAYLIPNLAKFMERCPNLDLRMSIGTEVADFEERNNDAAITWGYGGLPDFSEIPLIEDVKVVSIAPSLAQQHPLEKADDLLTHTLIAPFPGNTLWEDTFDLLGVNGAAQKPKLLLHTHDAMLEATLAGLGVGLISYVDAILHIKLGRLVAPFGTELLFQLPLARSPQFFLAYPSRRKPQTVLIEFSKWLKETVCQDSLIGFHSRCSRT